MIEVQARPARRPGASGQVRSSGAPWARAVCALGCGLVQACGSISASDPSSHPAHDATITFQSIEVPTTGSSTAPFTLVFEPGTQVFSIRVSSALPVDPRLAFTLEDLRANDGESWIDPPSVDDYGEYCRHCRERVSAGVGYGLFNLPSSAHSLQTIERASLRLGLRDCTTWLPWPSAAPTPAVLRVEWSGRSAPRDAQLLRLTAAVVLASAHGFVQGARDALLREALAKVQATWRQANIVVELSTPETIVAVPAVHVAPGDGADLIDLTMRARSALAAAHVTAAALFVLTPCLTFEDPIQRTHTTLQGRTTHLPGGLGVGDEPDAMFVSVESCSAARPLYDASESTALGAVLAHELGHFLGLYHVYEADGSVDQLPDTLANEDNLMQPTAASAALSLTPSQIQVARRHPSLTPDL